MCGTAGDPSYTAVAAVLAARQQNKASCGVDVPNAPVYAVGGIVDTGWLGSMLAAAGGTKKVAWFFV